MKPFGAALLMAGALGAGVLTGCGSDSGPADAGTIAFMVMGVDDGAFHLARTRGDSTGTVDLVTPMGVSAGLPAFSADGARLAFVGYPAGSDDDADGSLYIANADGSAARAIVTARDAAFAEIGAAVGLEFPAFTPDGEEVGFAVSGKRGEVGYFVIAADGTGLRRLSSPPAEGLAESEGDRLTFSPDGATMVYSHPTDARHYDLYSASTRGGTPTLLARTSSVEPVMPAFSPDGTKLVYSVQDFDQQHANGSQLDTALFVVNADGTDPKRITDWGDAGEPDRMFATWSPDGSRIAFSVGLDGKKAGTSIGVVAADGGTVETVAKPSRGDAYVYPAWTAGGGA